MNIVEFKNHGFFEEYVPEEPITSGALYSRHTETKECWYKFVKTLEKNLKTVKILLNKEKRIISAANDATTLFPIDLEIIEFLNPSCKKEDLHGKWFDVEQGVIYRIDIKGNRVDE